MVSIPKKTDFSKIVIDLLTGHPDDVSLRSLATKEGFKNIFWHQDPKIIGDVRDKFLSYINDVSEKSWDDVRKDLVISQLLSILPHLSPPKGEEIQIPQLINGKWKKITYVIDQLPLMPKWLPKYDQYDAMALTATDESAPPLMIFMGTGYPAAKGFWTTLLADLFPFYDVGALIARSGRSILRKWFGKNEGSKIIGLSLGGGLASLVSYQHADQNISEVTMFNPALPYAKPPPSKIKRRILINTNDPVSQLGSVADNDQLFQSTLSNPSKRNSFVSGFLSHVQVRSAQEGASYSVIGKEDIHAKRRWGANTLWYRVLRPLAFVFFLPIYLLHLIVGWIGDGFRVLGRLCVQKTTPKSSPKDLESGQRPSKTLEPRLFVPDSSEQLLSKEKEKPGKRPAH